MHEHKISSVPIVDTNEGGGLRLLGNISMSDIKELNHAGGWKKLYMNALRFFVDIRTAQGLEGPGDKVPWFIVNPKTTLISAIEKMAATRSHRVWVVTEGNILAGVISLSDVMDILSKEL